MRGAYWICRVGETFLRSFEGRRCLSFVFNSWNAESEGDRWLRARCGERYSERGDDGWGGACKASSGSASSSCARLSRTRSCHRVRFMGVRGADVGVDWVRGVEVVVVMVVERALTKCLVGSLGCYLARAGTVNV